MNKNNNPFDYFDAIYCINLDRRTDRWETVQREFDKVGIRERVVRFSAIETPENGAIGCLLSHRAIIQKAQDMGWKNVLVFEDDVEMVSNLNYLKSFIGELQNTKWDIAYFGGFFDIRNGHYRKINKYIGRVHGLWCTHAISYNESIFDSLFSLLGGNNFIDKYKSIDNFLYTWQQEIIALSPKKICMQQKHSVSNIDKTHVFNTFGNSMYLRWSVVTIKIINIPYQTMRYLYRKIRRNKNNNPFDYFDAIYCINLDRRTDRWETVQREFDKVGIRERVVRFSAIETPENGAIGCLLSHRAIIQKAQDMGWKNVLVFEDDVVFLKTMYNSFSTFYDLDNQKYDIFYLGGWFNIKKEQPQFKRISKKLFRISHLWSTFAICYSINFYDDFLANFPKDNDLDMKFLDKYKSIDNWLMSLQDKKICLAPKNMLVTHGGATMSDVQTYKLKKYVFPLHWMIAKHKILFLLYKIYQHVKK